MTPDANSDAETLRRIAAERFTCRAYLADPVPDETIASIFDIARRTASWSNLQPWHLTIARKPATDAFRAALMEEAVKSHNVESDIPFPAGYPGVFGERRREVGYQLYAALGIERHDHKRRSEQSFENFRLFGAPHVALVTSAAELGPYGVLDTGAFVGAFLLAAQAHGVATTAQAALARHSGFVKSYFGIGEDRDFVCGIAFGYPDRAHPVNNYRTGRAPVEQVMTLV
jgi:nitroreductase